MDPPESSTMYQLNTTEDAMNGTEMYPELPNMEMYAILVPTIWGIITITGALGNALVIYTLVRHGDKNATNYFVINLAISDFAFVVIVTPLTATMYALPHWIFGSGMCKITMYMIYVSIALCKITMYMVYLSIALCKITIYMIYVSIALCKITMYMGYSIALCKITMHMIYVSIALHLCQRIGGTS